MKNLIPNAMNDFDFYIVKAYSPSIRSLMKVGTFERTAIKSKTDWSGRFPKTLYAVNLGYTNVMNLGHMEARKRAEQMMDMLPSIDRVNYHIEFILRD
jgi:Ni,Fe-hydrogenase I large subunit